MLADGDGGSVAADAFGFGCFAIWGIRFRDFRIWVFCDLGLDFG